MYEEIILKQLAVISLSDWPIFHVDKRTDNAVTSTCHALPLSALKHWWLENFDLDTVVKNKSTVVQRGLYSYRESITFWPLLWRIPFSIRVQTTLNHCRCDKFIDFQTVYNQLAHNTKIWRTTNQYNLAKVTLVTPLGVNPTQTMFLSIGRCTYGQELWWNP